MAIGRPRKSPQELHSEQTCIGYKPSQWAQLEADAAKAQTTVTEFIRASSLGQKFTVIQSDAPDPETVDQLRRIGVNLNQIAKRLNERKSVAPSALTTTLDDLQTLLAKWMFDDPSHHHRAQL